MEWIGRDGKCPAHRATRSARRLDALVRERQKQLGHVLAALLVIVSRPERNAMATDSA
jgi:hypothetical protein